MVIVHLVCMKSFCFVLRHGRVRADVLSQRNINDFRSCELAVRREQDFSGESVVFYMLEERIVFQWNSALLKRRNQMSFTSDDDGKRPVDFHIKFPLERVRCLPIAATCNPLSHGPIEVSTAETMRVLFLSVQESCL